MSERATSASQPGVAAKHSYRAACIVWVGSQVSNDEAASPRKPKTSSERTGRAWPARW
jgi:hypothetical protein